MFPDPRHALALSWAAPSARRVPFPCQPFELDHPPLAQPRCFPPESPVSLGLSVSLPPTLLQVYSRAGTLSYPSLTISPKARVWDRVCAQ